MPNVIVSHKVRPGSEGEFRRLQRAIGDVVKTRAGFAGLELMEPVEGLQSDWVVIYRFSTDDTLCEWLKSDVRHELVEKLTATLSEPATFQVLADANRNTRAVSMVFAQCIEPGEEEKFQQWRAEILKAQAALPGFLGSESSPPVPGIQEHWVDIVRYDCAEHLEAWLASDARAKLIKNRPFAPKVFSEHRIASGLEAWFTTPHKPSLSPPPRWKQALTVLVALYPTVMILWLTVTPFTQSWPQAVRILVSNALGVALLTFLVMPLMTRLLAFWLRDNKANIHGTAAVLLILAAWLTFFLGRI